MDTSLTPWDPTTAPATPARPMPRLDFDTLVHLQRAHPAWKLLHAEHAPLVVAFLHRAFLEPNVRTRTMRDAASLLDDDLYTLRERGLSFPKTAAQYLDAWATDGQGWLRKYYAPGDDEPSIDLTPATERAVEWLQGLLQGRRHVATESRLLLVFDLLHQIVDGTNPDQGARIAELERKRAAIDDELARVRSGDVAVMDDATVKDRFVQMSALARGLLADFRELDASFRDLDRGVREQIAAWDGGKGALLDRVLGERDAIADSDQGRTFRAFWDFLMSSARQEELTDMLARVLALPPVGAMAPDPRLARIHFDWLGAGHVTQRTVARLSAQRLSARSRRAKRSVHASHGRTTASQHMHRRSDSITPSRASIPPSAVRRAERTAPSRASKRRRSWKPAARSSMTSSTSNWATGSPRSRSKQRASSASCTTT